MEVAQQSNKMFEYKSAQSQDCANSGFRWLEVVAPSFELILKLSRANPSLGHPCKQQINFHT